jgi:hypothetical protein
MLGHGATALALATTALFLAGCGAPIQPITVTPSSDTFTLPPPQGTLGDYYDIDIKPAPGCAANQIEDSAANSFINIYSDFNEFSNPPVGQETTIKVPLGDWVNHSAETYTLSLSGQGCTDQWGSMTLTWDGADG